MKKEQKIIDLLKTKDRPLTAREITEHLYGKDKYQSIVFGTLQEMVIKGVMKKVGVKQPYEYTLLNVIRTEVQLPEKISERSDPKVPLKNDSSFNRNDDFLNILLDFFDEIIKKEIEIYNEYSLQHELGIYLREKYPNFKVQFERNVSHFFPHAQTIKKEVDIVVYNNDKSEMYAIELKAPTNGQYPEQMYAFVKDIKFMEELKIEGFTNTYAITLVCDRPFYQGNINNGIYRYFREDHIVYGSVYKPTGIDKESEYISLLGSYAIDWIELDEVRKYYIVAI